MFRLLAALASAACALCVASSASAVVADIGAQGFTVRHVVVVNAAPDAVWKALVDIGSWWDMTTAIRRTERTRRDRGIASGA